MFYILLENGAPKNHPIAADNFRLAFPQVDLENLPPWVAPFEKMPIPQEGPYEEFSHTTYEMTSGVVREVHHFRQFSLVEKEAKQAAVQVEWAVDGYPSWTFDELSCTYMPPVPHPNDSGQYVWDENTLSWVTIPLPA